MNNDHFTQSAYGDELDQREDDANQDVNAGGCWGDLAWAFGGLALWIVGGWYFGG